MAVSFGDTSVANDGAYAVADALPLLGYLQLDLGSCSNLHAMIEATSGAEAFARPPHGAKPALVLTDIQQDVQ